MSGVALNSTGQQLRESPQLEKRTADWIPSDIAGNAKTTDSRLFGFAGIGVIHQPDVYSAPGWKHLEKID